MPDKKKPVPEIPKTYWGMTAEQWSKMGSDSIDLLSKLWCKNGDYWTVRAYMLENVKTAFDKNGITIPFNQLDVNIKGQ